MGTLPLRTFSPYGLSKTLTFQTFRYYCERAAMPLGKFVIPNPFGPLEEERFTAYLCRNWREGKKPAVKTPDYLRDNIPCDLLAKMYAQFCESVASGVEKSSKSNPSGYIESQGAFALRVAREMSSRTGWNCDVELAEQTAFDEPLARMNFEPAKHRVPGWSESAFWDSYAEYYR